MVSVRIEASEELHAALKIRAFKERKPLKDLVMEILAKAIEER